MFRRLAPLGSDEGSFFEFCGEFDEVGVGLDVAEEERGVFGGEGREC